MDEAILDSDILSEVLKGKNSHVAAKARTYLAQHGRLAFSAITYYEILRGIQANRATRLMQSFQQTTAGADLLPISVPVLERAAQLWVSANAGGHPRGDADLIIAATALEAQRVLVTGNTAHFSWITGLRLADWRSAKP